MRWWRSIGGEEVNVGARFRNKFELFYSKKYMRGTFDGFLVVDNVNIIKIGLL